MKKNDKEKNGITIYCLDKNKDIKETLTEKEEQEYLIENQEIEALLKNTEDIYNSLYI